MRTRQLNRALALLVFAVSFAVYFATMAETVPYWDCGEFIATSFIMGVPHPPGSPLYLILGRLFTLLPIHPDIAFRVNLISPLVSAAAVMFLYLIIVQLVARWRGSLESTSDRLAAMGGALIGSLAFAFTDSHWFNAVEAEVYSVSTLLTAIVVWLILRWEERADEVGAERYLLIISYVLGLATGIHLLNLLALPFMGVVIYFRKRVFAWRSFLGTAAIVVVFFLTVYLGIIKGFPKLASVIGIWGVSAAVVLLAAVCVHAVRRGWAGASFALGSILLIVLGYSTYLTLFIRSQQNPAIDENDPETVERAISYLEREQYGEEWVLPRRFNSLPEKHEALNSLPPYTARQERQYRFYEFGRQMDFLWDYQLVKMYFRYFLWQFAGRGSADDDWVSNLGAIASRDEDGVNWLQFGLPLALALGIVGVVYQFRKDPHHWLSVMALFLLTGVAIIFYLNQNDPQPRERDYSYVGSFFAFAVWVGMGASAMVEFLLRRFGETRRAIGMASGALALTAMLVPGVMAYGNYRSHDRSGNRVAWDYSFNILQTCEPNGIVFTNGDNDTFPLWYLQQVEGIRKDVTVVNLSLLNTEWYIRQLRDGRPSGQRFVTLTDQQIHGEAVLGTNPATGGPLYLGVQRWQPTSVSVAVAADPQNRDGKIEWQLPATFGRNAIRIQDLMIFHIIRENQWRDPIYFAVTVADNNKIGLSRYLEMEGLAFRLRSHAVSPVNYERLERNLTQTYQYRNLDDPDVYYDPNVIRLLQNYRSAFLQLVDKETRDYEDEKRRGKPDADLQELRKRALKFLQVMESSLPESVIPLRSDALKYHIGMAYRRLGEAATGVRYFESVYRENLSEPQIVGTLLAAYEELDRWDDAISILSAWLKDHPADSSAARRLDNYQSRKASPVAS